MSVLAKVPMERIRADSAQVQWGRTLLTALVGALYVLGWAAGKAVGYVLAALTMTLYAIGRAAGWTFAAVRLGWQDAQAAQARR